MSSTYNFTNLNSDAGAYPYQGPTSNAGYNGTNLQGTTIVGGIQEWTVPTTGTYSIEAWGASGGDGNNSSPTRYGGVGRYVKITMILTQGTDIYVLVGQGGHRTYTSCGGGGGGSFVTKVKGSGANSSDILVIAGGGGGGGKGYGSGTGQSPEINARSVSSNGGYSYDYHTNGGVNLGGTGGGGGQSTGSRKTQGSTGGGGFIGRRRFSRKALQVHWPWFPFPDAYSNSLHLHWTTPYHPVRPSMMWSMACRPANVSG